MNIIIKKQKLENPGIDPGASRMQIERSTTWANIDSIHQSFPLFPRELQLAMNIIIKKQELENSVSIPVTLEYKSIALPLELIPLCIVSIDQSFPYFLVSCN